MKKYLLSFLLCSIIFYSNAQQTGDFTRTILTVDPQLSGDSLHIYFHIPAGFDFGQPAKIIIGQHGLGDPENSTQIRQYISGAADSINAIAMCPDPYLQDQPKSRAALNQAITMGATWYMIDTSEMYIAGYSAGSDVAAQYVFENPEHRMKGLIWHSPGFFSTPDMGNQQTFPPVCLCYGTSDFVSLLQANSLDNTFSSSTVPYLYNEIPGVGHTMNYPGITTELLECLNFIDAASISGIHEQGGKNVHVFPNPVSGNDVLTITGLTENATVEIADLTGKLLASYPVEYSGTFQIQNISRQFESGMYVLRIAGEKDVVLKRIIMK